MLAETDFTYIVSAARVQCDCRETVQLDCSREWRRLRSATQGINSSISVWRYALLLIVAKRALLQAGDLICELWTNEYELHASA